jgi:hypothetical protein
MAAGEMRLCLVETLEDVRQGLRGYRAVVSTETT